MAYEFMGYVRPDGQVGCRNHVAVMPSVTCAGDVASAIVRQVAGTGAISTTKAAASFRLTSTVSPKRSSRWAKAPMWQRSWW